MGASPRKRDIKLNKPDMGAVNGCNRVLAGLAFSRGHDRRNILSDIRSNQSTRPGEGYNPNGEEIMNSSLKLPAIVLLLGWSLPVHADNGGTQFSQVLLTIAIVLGVVASVYVFLLSTRMGGGAISTALFLYGLGMLSVVVSLLSVTWLKTVLASYASVAHDSFFIIGFVLMVLGSQKVSRLFMGRR